MYGDSSIVIDKIVPQRGGYHWLPPNSLLPGYANEWLGIKVPWLVCRIRGFFFSFLFGRCSDITFHTCFSWLDLMVMIPIHLLDTGFPRLFQYHKLYEFHPFEASKLCSGAATAFEYSIPILWPFIHQSRRAGEGHWRLTSHDLRKPCQVDGSV